MTVDRILLAFDNPSGRYHSLSSQKPRFLREVDAMGHFITTVASDEDLRRLDNELVARTDLLGDPYILHAARIIAIYLEGRISPSRLYLSLVGESHLPMLETILQQVLAPLVDHDAPRRTLPYRVWDRIVAILTSGRNRGVDRATRFWLMDSVAAAYRCRLADSGLNCTPIDRWAAGRPPSYPEALHILLYLFARYNELGPTGFSALFKNTDSLEYRFYNRCARRWKDFGLPGRELVVDLGFDPSPVFVEKRYLSSAWLTRIHRYGLWVLLIIFALLNYTFLTVKGCAVNTELEQVIADVKNTSAVESPSSE
jgi:hypothetical protein